MIIGNFKAKMDKKEFSRDAAGKETIHNVTNDNGTRMNQLASILNTFIVQGTAYQPYLSISLWMERLGARNTSYRIRRRPGINNNR